MFSLGGATAHPAGCGSPSRCRADASEDFGPERARDFGAVSGSVGLTVPVGNLLSFGGSVARAFRAPTTEELNAQIHAIPAMQELNIGHFLISESVFLGLEGAIREMRARMDAARA